MILYILFIVLSALLTVIALGLTIGGLMKKTKSLWITSLTAFVVLTLVTVFSVYTYVKKSVDYMVSDEFQAEVEKKAEAAGKSLGKKATGFSRGLESTLDEKVIGKLANKGAKIVGEGIKAASSGLDTTLGKTTVFTDESAALAGVKLGRAERTADVSKYGLGLFLEFRKDFDGTLRLTAYDSAGDPMDKAEQRVKEKAGKAQVFIFQFAHFQPGVSGYCVLTKSK